jgi:hypothetical protein
MDMIQSRNRSSHTYNERIAEEIARAILASYFQQFAKFEERFLSLEREHS